ncbi:MULTISPECIES: BREX-1 system phosphatase PglZ type A [unclassified Azospirillum]|uniref:BREX-1 system phosphatase PglZ type A n=1 Tax=unclassified Azospirillum TaxID=2630922 RepID=UPI000B6E435B|nr:MULTISPECIES: BREX-1 system phosphatase PglZ type A [unclassified Azospirillum]SNT15533.1 TIGR02687 family protein [Azospirillum sp. RU38E]SNT28428.1 TIGR02687 family protein [Azospirillum sp. RU37A]
MIERIKASLARLFEEHRIIVWYDAGGEMRALFDALDFSDTGGDVEKCVIANNEFGLKYRVLRQEPKRCFLLYAPIAEPAPADNWLLDLQLGGYLFKADQTALWLADLGLDGKYADVITDHVEFFRAKARLEGLKALRDRLRSKDQMRLCLLSVCTGTDGGLDQVVEALLADLAAGREESWHLIDRANLTGFLWKQLAQSYFYRPAAPDLEDFAIALFKAAYAQALGEDAGLNAEAGLLFRRWKNNRLGAPSFEVLSLRYQEVLNIAGEVTGRDVRSLLAVDHFDAVERHVIRQCVAALSDQSVAAGEVQRWIRERRQSHWFSRYEDLYQALDHAARFQQAMATAELGMASAEEGFRRYVASWYQIDQFYRKFVHHMQRSGHPGLLADLFTTIENRYSTRFLLALNDAWQDQVARMRDWTLPGIDRQINFWQDHAAKFRRKDQKIVVIISDALRFEVADECLSRIRALNRFDAELTAMLGALPSYTQLGMAALLPHAGLRIAHDDSAQVYAGDSLLTGTAARERQLATAPDSGRVKAMRAEEALAMHNDDGRDLFRDHDTIYIYHNRIDAVGDKLATEDRLAEAADDAIDDLVKLVRRLTSANFSNILITADHGFLYQHRPLDESDYAIAEPQGAAILVRNRRFVLGRQLQETPGLKHFTAAQLGLGDGPDVLIPNSINRLRVKGAGARFVHGGASLQEVVVPLLRVSKRREADLRQVDVQIIVTGRSQITSGQIAVAFYQAEPVSAKVQPRELLVGLYAEDGTLISDEQVLTFDFSSDNPRERELSRKFLLSRAADAYNTKDVFLKLRERVGRTSHHQDYSQHRFQLRRGIVSDFDF